MTSPRPETTDRTQKIEDKDTDKDQAKGLQLSATQVAAGALASVSSAVVASFFGLAGTLIGAALASVISTVSAALYSSSLHKTNEKLRIARSQLTGRQSPVADTEDAPAPPATPAPLDEGGRLRRRRLRHGHGRHHRHRADRAEAGVRARRRHADVAGDHDRRDHQRVVVLRRAGGGAVVAVLH